MANHFGRNYICDFENSQFLFQFCNSKPLNISLPVLVYFELNIGYSVEIYELPHVLKTVLVFSAFSQFRILKSVYS